VAARVWLWNYSVKIHRTDVPSCFVAGRALPVANFGGLRMQDGLLLHYDEQTLKLGEVGPLCRSVMYALETPPELTEDDDLAGVY